MKLTPRALASQISQHLENPDNLDGLTEWLINSPCELEIDLAHEIEEALRSPSAPSDFKEIEQFVLDLLTPSLEKED